MITCDTDQLHKIGHSIAELESRPPRDQVRLKCLIEALRQKTARVARRGSTANRPAFSMGALALSRSR